MQRDREGIRKTKRLVLQKILYAIFFNPSHRRYRSSVSPLYFAEQNTGEKEQYQQQEQNWVLPSLPAASRSITGYRTVIGKVPTGRGDWKDYIIFDGGGKGIKGQSPLIIDWVLLSPLDPTIFA